LVCASLPDRRQQTEWLVKRDVFRKGNHSGAQSILIEARPNSRIQLQRSKRSHSSKRMREYAYS
jgi:hypothetical protein